MEVFNKTGKVSLRIYNTANRTKCFASHIMFVAMFVLFSNINVFAQKQLNITPGSYLVLNGNVALVTNNASINNNGTIVPGAATFYFTGNSDTTISNITGTSTTTCTNLTINKSAFGTAIKSQVHVTGVLTMGSGNLYADSNLTLISDANNTARVAPVPASCNIVGKAFVQRYVPAQRKWRLLTAPVTSSNTIYDSWQNGGVYTVGKGMFITSPNPNIANGTDPSPEKNYSTLAFNPSTQSLYGVANTYTNISPGTNGSADNAGYMTFVRGDRSPSNVYIPNTNVTTLTSAGKLQTGDQNFTAVTTSGSLTLIGNPYASPLDFSKISRSNIVNRFYVWDPTLNLLGAFVILDDLDGDGLYDLSVSGSIETKEIQSGQAFFVQTYASGPASVTISESAKSTTNSNLVFRPASPTPSFRANLYLLNADSSSTLADGALEQFDNRFSDSVNLDDAKKIGNLNENLGFLRHGRTLGIERRPDINLDDTLFLSLTSTNKRNYQFRFTGNNITAPGIAAFLQDSSLGTSTPIGLNGTSTVNFSITSASGSSNSNRFRIVFKPSSPLPVTFISIKANEQQIGVSIEWQVANEINIRNYEVEKSTDSRNFITVGIVAATGNNNTASLYNWKDVNTAGGNNFYRIKAISNSGGIEYSHVVEIVSGNTESFISVYPNPIVDNIINIQFNNELADNYQIALYNTDGQLVYENKIAVTGNNTTAALSINQPLAKGVYQLSIQSAKGKISTQKIIVR